MRANWEGPVDKGRSHLSRSPEVRGEIVSQRARGREERRGGPFR